MIVLILILVIVVLLGVVLYTFAIRPAISGYVVNRQNEGVQFAVASIMQQATQQCQPVPLTFGNQTIHMIAIGCPGTEAIANAMQQSQQQAVPAQ